MSCVCKLIHSPHLSRLKEGSCSARPAITMPQSRALSAVQSQLVPHIINECFSIKASLIHWLHTHKKRLLHFHFNRYTPISYIRMILQAQNSLWHSTCHGRMLSDFSMYLVCYWPVSCFHGNVWLLLKCPLKTLLANTLKFVRFGMNSTSTSVFHQFLFFLFVCFFTSSSSSHHFKRKRVLSLPQYGSVILLYQSPSMQSPHWLDRYIYYIYILICVFSKILVTLYRIKEIWMCSKKRNRKGRN